MKKMISKKIVSFLVAAAMLITSTAVVLADNVTTSESGNQWTAQQSSITGSGYTVGDDGVLTMTRSIFRTEANGVRTFWVADESTGKWKVHGTLTKGDNGSYGSKLDDGSAMPNLTNATWDVKTETDIGRAQAKFDFKFDGGNNQRFYAYFDGYLGSGTTTGLAVNKDGIQIITPNKFWSKNAYTFADGTWYTLTLTLDLDGGVIGYSVSAKNSSEVIISDDYTIVDGTDVAAGTTSNSVTKLVFRSPVDSDFTDGSATMKAYGDVAVAESVWHIANIEYDAYTKTNYELKNVYKSTDGMVSNKESASTPFAGVGLTRLTRVADPANASLITASYDANTRMEKVDVTPLSSVTTAPVHSTVTGNTIKSFIFDMNTANPFVDAYQYTEPTVTERSIDFNEGCSVATTKTKADITTQGSYLNSTYGDVSVGIENGALKFERKNFRQKNSSDSNMYCYTYGENGITTFGTASSTNNTNVTTNTQAHYVVRLDKTVSKVTGQLKFKFAGLDHPSGYQHITVALGSGTGAPGQYLIRIMRKADGSGSFRTGFSSYLTWTANSPMKANEWYTLDFTYDYNATNQISVDITGDFGGTETTKSWAGAATTYDKPETFDYVAIYSHYNDDYAFPASECTSPTTGWSTKTSVWYIDDINVKY